MPEPKLITPGVIAARLGVPLHRVTWVLRTRSHIRPAAMAGVFRLYREADVEAVREALAEIGGRKGSRRK